MAMAGGVGVRVERLPDGMPAATALFSESASRVVVGVAEAQVATVLDAAAAAGVATLELGVSGGDRFAVAGACDEDLADLTAAWRGAIPALMGV
jgi:phosphoribosylformylglycinamidine synthase